ncbi:MAG: GNAT family N-acetyltransferase [Candidatus Aenigmatarchaeota archaeon]
MIVRKASEEDIPRVVPLWRELDESIKPLIAGSPVLVEYGKLKPSAPEVFEKELRENLGKETHVQLVAEEGGKALGYLLAYVKERGKEKIVGKKMYLRHILVSKEARSKGVGSALVKELEKITRGMGIGFIALKTYHKNEEVVDFYLKNGFEKRFIEMVKKV